MSKLSHSREPSESGTSLAQRREPTASIFDIELAFITSDGKTTISNISSSRELVFTVVHFYCTRFNSAVHPHARAAALRWFELSCAKSCANRKTPLGGVLPRAALSLRLRYPTEHDHVSFPLVRLSLNVQATPSTPALIKGLFFALLNGTVPPIFSLFL